MVSVFFGTSSTLAARLVGVGRRVFSASHCRLLLDRWGFALELRTVCRHLAHVPRRLHGGHVRRPPARWDCGPGGAAQPLFSDPSRRRSPARSAGGVRASCQMPCWSALRQPTRREGMACTAPCTIARRCTSAPRATGGRGCLMRAGGVWTIGSAACTPATIATLGSWIRRIILTSRTRVRAWGSIPHEE